MNRFGSIVVLLALLFVVSAPAADNVLREPVFRAVSPDWADLGRSDFPFYHLYVDQIVLDGTNFTPPTITVTNAITGDPGTMVIVTNIGNAIAAVLQFTIPRGADGTNGVNGVNGTNGVNGIDGTNFATVQLFTNSVLSSQQILTYQTNNVFWGRSNFLARVHGIYSWVLFEGDDAGNPPENIIGGLIASYSGTNAWFGITNGFWTTNDISIAQTNTGVSLRGSAQVNPGNARLYSVDHLELIGRTNYFFAQHTKFDEPTSGSDAATKSYVDAAVANTLSPFLMTQDTNGVKHVSYSYNAQTIMDITSAGGWMRIDSFTPSGTNGLLSIAQTNFIAGWQIQSSTNLALVNGWTTFTNWTAMTTNAGEVTFKIPLLLPQQFFRAQVPATNNVTIAGAPLTIAGAPLTGGGIFKVIVTTNTPTIGDFNNQKGVCEMISNGFEFIIGSTNGTTTYTKVIAP